MATIEELTSYVLSQITEVLSVAQDAQTDLTNIAAGRQTIFEFSNPPEYTPAVNFTPKNITLPNVPGILNPSVRVNEYQQLNTYKTVSAFEKGTLNQINVDTALGDIADYETPPEVEGFDPGTFDPSTVDAEITSLADSILGLINSGGTGVDSEAIFNATRERDLQILSDELLQVAATGAMTGFPSRISMDNAARDAVLARFDQNRQTSSRDITALMAKTANDTLIAALNAGISLNQTKATLAHGVYQLQYSLQGLLLEKNKTDITTALTKYDAGVKKVLAEADLKKIAAEIEKDVNIATFQAGITAEQARIESDTRLVQTEYDILKTRALTEKEIAVAQLQTELAVGEANSRSETAIATTRAEIELRSDALNADVAVKISDLQLRNFVDRLNLLTERGKADIEMLSQDNQRRLAAASAQVEYYKGIVTSLSQMVNTMMSKKVTA